MNEIPLVFLVLKPLSYLGPYSFRSWVMDTFCPFLGSFGRSISKFRLILRTMDDTGHSLYRERQAFVASEAAQTESEHFTKSDVLSNLRQSIPIQPINSEIAVPRSKSNI